MRAAGVNRISFGAQSFNDERLKFLGRIHGAAETREAARLAHRAGFERLNLDLIFAVPGQTVDEALNDIAEAAALGPDHISAYNLTFEEGTAFFTEMKRGRIRPIDSDQQAEFYAAVREELPRRGYQMYEISNYAPPGHEARHNLTYWRLESYLGLGAGAHSFARDESGGGGRRWWNERMPARYVERRLRAASRRRAARRLTPHSRARRVRVSEPAPARRFCARRFRGALRCELRRVFGAHAARLFEGELLVRDEGRIRLSDRGLELADSVFAEFV